MEQVVWQGRPSLKTSLCVSFIFLLMLCVSEAAFHSIWFLVFSLSLAYGVMKRFSLFYTVTTAGVRTEQGLVTRQIQQANMAEIQTVRLRQNPIQVFFNIGTLEIIRGGGPEGQIFFVDIPSPQDVKMKILTYCSPTITQERSDATGPGKRNRPLL